MAQSEGVVTDLQLRLLGPVEVVRDGRRVRLPGAKPTTLLALLAIHEGKAVGTDRLAEGLWGDRPPRSSDAVLRTYVAQLRRVLGAGAIETRPDGYALRVSPACIDARVFERLLAQARAGNPGRPAVTSARLRRPLALWRGAAFGELASEAFAIAENLLSDLAQVRSAQGDDPAAVRSLLAERDRLRVELGLPGRDPWTV